MTHKLYARTIHWPLALALTLTLTLTLTLGLSGGAVWAQGPVLTGTAPVANAASYPPGSPLFVAFQAGLALPFGGSTTAMKVFSTQRGGQRTGNSGGVNYQPFAPPSLIFTSVDFPFRPGETVGVSLTAAITSQANGQPLAPPKVFQFTTATGGTGRGNFRGVANTGPGTANLGRPQLADVDGDGDLDLVGTYASLTGGAGTVAVLRNGGNGLGGGTGNFGPATGTAVPAGAGLLAVADLDGDGDLDLLTCADRAATAVLTLLRNDGAGTFVPVVAGAAPLAAPSALAVGDVDGDGDLDLATIETGSGTFCVYPNTGSGVFGAATAVLAYALGWENPVALALADADNDYDLDLVVAIGNDTGGTELVVYLNGGDATGSNTGAFSDAPGAVAGGFARGVPGGLALGDLNADGNLDVVILTYNTGAQLLLGTGTGNFVSGTSAPAAASARALALADIDADGDLDMLSLGAAGGVPGVGELMTRFNNGRGGFGTGRTTPVGVLGRELALGDLDGDGDVDAVAAGARVAGMEVFFNEAVLATAAQSLAAQVAVFPNPVAGANSVTVAAPAGATVAVFDALGRAVAAPVAVGAGGTLRLPTAGLAAGLYVVRVRSASGEVARRLAVE